jgi:hypothetical protein
VHEVVATLREALDGGRQARHAHLEPRVERDVDLGHRRQAAIHVRIRGDHLDVEARDALLADALEEPRDAVSAAEAVGHERDARRLGVAVHQLELLAPEHGRGGHVRDRGQAGLEEVDPGSQELGA